MKRYILSALLLLASAGLFAQSLSFLTINNDARAVGMAGATVATPADAFALENNAASMAFFDGTLDVAASFNMWQPQFANIKMPAIGAMMKVNDQLAVGISGRYGIEQPYTIAGASGGITGTFTPVEFSAGLGAAYRVIDCLSLGVNVKFASSTLAADAAATAIGGDISLMYSANGLSAGLSVDNIGTSVKYQNASYPMPMRVRGGAAYTVEAGETSVLTAALEADYLADGGIAAALGLDFQVARMFSVRAGYHYGNAAQTLPSHLSVGAGLEFLGVSLSAAYLMTVNASPVYNTLCATLGYRF